MSSTLRPAEDTSPSVARKPRPPGLASATTAVPISGYMLNGKTTTSHLLAAALRTAGPVAHNHDAPVRSTPVATSVCFLSSGASNNCARPREARPSP